MVKKHSTSALTEEQKKSQNKRYEEGHEYDYLIIGTGSSALTAGSLLAKAGHKVCMLEAHDIAGGYLQNFHMDDFYFCAQVHYIWGCGPGGKIYEFLKHIGLEKDITFELFDPEGYDHMAMPDGKRVKIPYGFDKLVENIEEAYPGQGEKVKKFTEIIETLRHEMRFIPDRKIGIWDYITKFTKVMNVVKYRNSTVQDVFDECGLSKEAQAVLIANAGDFMLPPERLSIFPYVGLFGGYNTGAYYPTKHFRYYVDRLTGFIEEHDGCHIYYESEVTEINVSGDAVTEVKTKDGKTFKAKNFICNMDPQRAAHMIGWDKFPSEAKEKLSYEYSAAGVVIYLGLKDIDLREHGFGNFNIWHLEQWDMNKMWKEQAVCDFSSPWIFMSTPTLHSDEPGTAPEGHHILEVAAYTEYKPFMEAQEEGYAKYAQLKKKIADRMLEIVKEKYIPNLDQHIKVKVVGTSVTNEDFCMAPGGNAYGSEMTPKNITMNRLKANTPFKNLHWCNASSGWAGVYGTVTTGINLYMDLTGDRFYDGEKAPTDKQFIDELNERIKAEKS